jgi:hypothetical protein
MSAATELTPARPRTRSRATRKRDERVRRVVRWLKKDGTFLDKPRYAQQLRIYAGLTLKYETLLANINERYGDNLLDEVGHAIPALETLQRLAKTCASIGTQLGLAPGSERAMRHGMSVDADHSPWLRLANKKDEEIEAAEAAKTAAATPSPASASDAPAASAPEPAATNGTPKMPGFTSPA